MTISFQLFYGELSYAAYDGILYSGAIGCSNGSVPSTPYVILVAFAFRPYGNNSWRIDSSDGRFVITFPDHIPPIDPGLINVTFSGTVEQFNAEFGVQSGVALEARVAALETSQNQQNIALLALNAANDEKTQQIAELQSKVAGLESQVPLLSDQTVWLARNLSWALPQFPELSNSGNPFVVSLSVPVWFSQSAEQYISEDVGDHPYTQPRESNGSRPSRRNLPTTRDPRTSRRFVPRWRRN